MIVLKDNKFLPWLLPHWNNLSSLRERGHIPQALLVHGPAGTGRRFLARWLAARSLGIAEERCGEIAAAYIGGGNGVELIHPDFLEIGPPQDKLNIGVEQVRMLIEFLQLSSHSGGNRVAVLWPADAMTHTAANSLLKILEEPPPGAAIVLVAESPSQLPATIVSRCHRVRICLPAREVALRWLRAQDEHCDWELLLSFAGDAPIAALELDHAGFRSQAVDYEREIEELQAGRVSPVALARRWARLDLAPVIRWLYRRAAVTVAAAIVGQEDFSSEKKSNILLRRDPGAASIPRLFMQLRAIEELHRGRTRSLNLELQLSALLQQWWGGVPRSRGG